MSQDLSVGDNRQTPFSALRSFAPRRGEVATAEHCDLCSVEIGDEHPHLLEPASRRLVCVCLSCAILFDNPSETKYKRIPRRIRYLSDFRLTDAQWDDLRIPIQLAFFSTTRRTKETSLFNWVETSSHYTKLGNFRRHCEL